MKTLELKITPFPMELFLAFLGTTTSIVISLTIWHSLVGYQEIWLLPGMYFVEFMVGSLVVAILYTRDHKQAVLSAWIFSGVTLGFMVLAAFSVGFIYLPILLVFLALSIYSTIRRKAKLLQNLGYFLLGAAIQTGLMLLITQLYR